MSLRLSTSLLCVPWRKLLAVSESPGNTCASPRSTWRRVRMVAARRVDRRSPAARQARRRRVQDGYRRRLRAHSSRGCRFCAPRMRSTPQILRSPHPVPSPSVRRRCRTLRVVGRPASRRSADDPVAGRRALSRAARSAARSASRSHSTTRAAARRPRPTPSRGSAATKSGTNSNALRQPPRSTEHPVASRHRPPPARESSVVSRPRRPRSRRSARAISYTATRSTAR